MKVVFLVFCLGSIAFSAQQVHGRNSSVASDSATEFVASSVGEKDDVSQIQDRPIQESAKEVPAWSPQSSRLLSAIRKLLLEARESSDVTSQPSAAEQVDGDDIFKTLDRIFWRPQRTTTAKEATATSSNVSFESLGTESTTDADSSPIGTKSEPPNTETDLGSETAGVVFAASTSVSEGSADENGPCRRCYSDLQSCVQKCFLKHNCHQLERNARQCPPAPSRLCSPFAPWRPRDHQCMEHHECSSPLLCCNDGCFNRCVPGISKSTKS